MRHKLTEEEINILKPCVEKHQTTRYGYDLAVQKAKDASDELWSKIKKLYPNAITIHHPDEKDWELELKEEEEDEPKL